jgi:hypothetical protein
MAHKKRFQWLDMAECGSSSGAIAGRFRVSIRTVQLALADARAQLAGFAEARRLMQPPPLVMLFPLNGLFPGSRCNHRMVPIPGGSDLCCAICHQYGHDNHPCLDRFPAVEPKPDPAPRPRVMNGEPTRKQKRDARFGRRVPAA